MSIWERILVEILKALISFGKDTIWVYYKVSAFLLKVTSICWHFLSEYPVWDLLAGSFGNVLARCDASGVILHKVLIVLYLPVVFLCAREFFLENGLFLIDAFAGLFLLLCTRTLYLVWIKSTLSTNPGEVWACFMTFMTLKSVLFVSLEDIRAFSRARQGSFYPEEVLKAEAILHSRSFV